jgi:Family of unknown function (DUF6152)
MVMCNVYTFVIGFVAGCCLFVPPATAHHSGAGFNGEKMIELTGIIKEFQFTNPHTWIQFLVEDAKGEKVEWSAEWASPNNLGRQGIRPSTFPAGAAVTMRLRPMLNGSPAGAFVGAKFADGKIVGRWDDDATSAAGR